MSNQSGNSHRRVLLLAAIAMLTAIVVQPGQMSSIDTLERLQTTRSCWTTEPAVKPGGLGLVGRDGRMYDWYGMGQSLLMLPADILARSSARLIARFREPPWWLMGEETVVSYVTSTVVCVLAVVVCFRFLRLMSFTENQSLAGACSLLLGTTFLHYTQNLQENNYLILLTLTGFYFQYRWFRTGSVRSLLAGSAALGANLLTRLTTGLDLLAAAAFILACAYAEDDREHPAPRRLIEYARIAVPCYVVFVLIDRLYQYYRFGSFFTTYLGVYGRQWLGRLPGLSVYPPGWPWSESFWKGFFGPLISAEKSIFLFDPLLVLTFLLAWLLWRRLPLEWRAYLLTIAVLLFAYVCFYAKFFDWSGDTAWGDRYVTTPVQMLAMLGVPLLMRYRDELQRWVRNLGVALAAASVAIQAASIFFWCSLEVRQLLTMRRPVFVVGLRFVNIVAYALGTTERWGLANQYTRSAPPSSLTGPFFFPFLVLHRGAAPPAKEAALMTVWACTLGVLLWLLYRASVEIRASEKDA
jgi:hypothetical protein